jgi:hypothetical protein
MEQPTLSHRVAGEGDPLCTPPREACSPKRPWSTPQVTSHAGQRTDITIKYETGVEGQTIAGFPIGPSV